MTGSLRGAGRFAHPKIAGFGQSVFTEMSRLAREHGAVNLGQGFPDFAGPDFVKEAAIAAIGAEQNQYAVSHGEPALRKAIATTWTPQLDREIDPETEVTVTTGATEAIYAALQAFLGPGDELLAFEPFYDSYPAATLLAGATFVPVRLHAPDWPLPHEALESAVTPRTKALLLNTPHNPTGKVFTQAELEWVAAFAKQHDLLVITDEVYDRIVFGDAVHRSLAAMDGMWDRTLTIGSTGKTFSLTGWKIGYTIGPAALNRAVRVVHQFMTFATSTPFQMAMAHALTVAGTNGYYDELSAAYERRRQLLTDILIAAGLTPMPVSGSYFLMSDVSKFGFDSDVEFCTWLIREAGVVAIPPSAFYQEPDTAPLHARFCFAKSEDTLEDAGRRLARIANG
ncbi:MAG: aminotransferase class I/II-fold pyridoxal phosphate-dependent enzyme [Thermomicrobiales bacterium]|nr:aminotransferase class I/II-fold pyridoxal phosphate-dependent enzyme [Thermomicrobiales bacterium]